MVDKMTKKYMISGSGILSISGDMITICVEDKDEFNLANVLADLDNRPVHFSFSYDEDYECTSDIDEDTGEVI